MTDEKEGEGPGKRMTQDTSGVLPNKKADGKPGD